MCESIAPLPDHLHSSVSRSFAAPLASVVAVRQHVRKVLLQSKGSTNSALCTVAERRSEPPKPKRVVSLPWHRARAALGGRRAGDCASQPPRSCAPSLAPRPGTAAEQRPSKPTAGTPQERGRRWERTRRHAQGRRSKARSRRDRRPHRTHRERPGTCGASTACSPRSCRPGCAADCTPRGPGAKRRHAMRRRHVAARAASAAGSRPPGPSYSGSPSTPLAPARRGAENTETTIRKAEEVEELMKKYDLLAGKHVGRESGGQSRHWLLCQKPQGPTQVVHQRHEAHRWRRGLRGNREFHPRASRPVRTCSTTRSTIPCLLVGRSKDQQGE